MILLGILASTPINDCEMTCLGDVEMSVIWTSDNVSSVLTNISVWKSPNGECLCLMTFWKLCWGQRCFPMTLDVSVLPSGSCKLENSFLHGLILSTTEVEFFYLNDTNVLNVSFRNLQFSFSFSCCTHDLNDICWWTNNHGEKKKIVTDLERLAEQ